jgi:chromosome segregation ATPase
VKLNKKISEQSYSISKLTNDYNIAESTLHLTDQAFNEEVNLRLKFEEKVNAVFTSYEEIKMKYDKLIMDLQLKGEEELSTRQIEVNLRARLEQAEISNSELKRQISRVTEIVKEREDEIQVKQQEIYELTATVTEFSEKKDENEEDVRRIIVKLDHFRQINENQANEIDIKSNLIKEYQNRIREQQKLIDNARAANEKVYQKYESTGKLLGDFNAERIVLINQTQSAEAEALTSKAEKEAI